MPISINIWQNQTIDSQVLADLVDVLLDCVVGGASVGFMLPLPRDRAEAFWRTVSMGVNKGERVLLTARDEAGVCGTVQLLLDVPENQRHRADLAKLLVHRRARRCGIGSALLLRAEHAARSLERTLLTLDAVTDGAAARLYASNGWTQVGDIPNYALMPDGNPCSTTVFFKSLVD